MKELKTNQKSIRFTDTVKNYIEKQKGEGFNEKFENMVIYCIEKLPEVEKQIKEKEKQLTRLNDKVTNAQSILNELDSLKYSVELALKRANKLIQEK